MHRRKSYLQQNPSHRDHNRSVDPLECPTKLSKSGSISLFSPIHHYSLPSYISMGHQDIRSPNLVEQTTQSSMCSNITEHGEELRIMSILEHVRTTYRAR
ncbi:hypothetical protein CDL15_Pgr004859 [Punica granatum]|uniref:Uncharacterized protein n=1 Tax=Punica granatum TaxID=22663 RepID=A0A218W677_PUNGR|nr:hypothetical protein CDL15_Pgr004859 [Punica granatum]